MRALVTNMGEWQSESDSSRGLSRRSVLFTLGSGSIFAGGVLLSREYLAFSSVTAPREVSVDVADDPNAIIGLNINSPVTKNAREELVDIENNTEETIDVTVSLDDCSQGTLYDSDESGCSVTLSIAPGAIKSVDIEATVAETLPFTISATSPDLSFEAPRETTAEPGTTGPTADAGGPYTVDETRSVELDGTASTGTSLTYSWTITDSPGSLDDASTSTPVYNAPSVQQNTTVTVELTITDNQGQSDTDTATITVNNVGSPPTIDTLTITKTGGQNRMFDIQADVSDPDGDLDRVMVTATNTQSTQTDYSNTVTVSGSSDSISDTTAQLPNNTEYRIDVTVYDTNDATDTESQIKTTG